MLRFDEFAFNVIFSERADKLTMSDLGLNRKDFDSMSERELLVLIAKRVL